MIEFVISMWLQAMTPTQAEAESLSRTLAAEKMCKITTDEASELIKWARFGAQLYNVRYDKLIGIATHESACRPRTVQIEPRDPRHPRWGKRVSCGVMTPVPHYGRCSEEELTYEGGFRNGAAHYREWLDDPTCRGREWCADIAFGGGSWSAILCARGVRVRAPSGNSVCALHRDFERRARIVRRAIESVQGS